MPVVMINLVIMQVRMMSSSHGLLNKRNCVDFCLGAGDGPRLDLELGSGQVISRLVDINRSGSNSVMSVNELSNQDEIEFQLTTPLSCYTFSGVSIKYYYQLAKINHSCYMPPYVLDVANIWAKRGYNFSKFHQIYLINTKLMW